MKKGLWLSLVLALLLLSQCAAAEYADSAARTSGDYSYTLLADGTAEITQYNGQDRYLIIPSALDGHIVSALGKNAFAAAIMLDSAAGRADRNEGYIGCWFLVSVIIPDGVTTIGESVFSNGIYLKRVTIPDSVTVIGDSAFDFCLSLTRAILPDSVTVIGDQAFSGCRKLSHLTLGSGVAAIGFQSFSGCESLNQVILPNSLTTIGKFAFSGCSSLTGLNLPDSLTEIGAYAFSSCDQLTLTAGRGSYAEQYCLEHALAYRYPDPAD